jgi:hypothetical protein
MRTLLVVFCALLMMNFSLEAKKKIKMPATQKTQAAKQHRAASKKIVKSRKAPKHRQSVN